MQAPKACLIVIGNEILSGRTQDVHISWLARELNEIGVRLAEARVVADDEAAIVGAVNECRRAYDYVFTTGGIGPTHDDITAACIAKAFCVKIAPHPEAVEILTRHYGKDKLNDARLRMAQTPEGAALIPNPLSGAPGWRMENVYVLAGVPNIMRGMFESVKPTLKGGAKTLSRTYSAYVTEGVIAEKLTAIALRHADVEIGSYPFTREGRLGTTLVARTTDSEKLEKAAAEIRALLADSGREVIEGDPG